MNRIKIAQIGVGHDHSDLITSLIRQSDIFDVKGFCVCDGEESHYELVRDQFFSGATRVTLDDILNDPELDAVAIETTEANLTKYARLALEKGLHVHMDKPGSADHAAFTEMVRLAEKKNLVFHVGYMYRYNPAVEYAREVVKSGKLGTVYSVEAQMNGLHSAEKRQWMDSFPGGMQFFLGCHLIDLIVQLQGIPSEIIPCNKETGFDGVMATDFGMTVFRYPNGISFAKACDAEPGGFARRQLVICGEKGTLEIRPMEKYIVPAPDEKNMYTAIREVYYDKAAKLGWNYDGEYRQLDPFNRYDHMTRSLASYIRGEAKNPWTYDYEIALHEIISRACGTL